MSVDDQLVSLAYTSIVANDLDDDAVYALYKQSSANNALDGITGLLVFNGSTFVQIVQGSGRAIAHLIERLRRDERHHDFRMEEVELIDRRSFGGWDMKMIRVSRAHLEAVQSLEQALGPSVTPGIRKQLLSLVERVSETV